MEVLLRCEIPDRPGMLATLAGAIGRAGGDIHAVEVVEAADGVAIDDLWVNTDDLAAVMASVKSVEGGRLIHAGPSRGLPGDATSRLATGIDALMSGAMLAEDGVRTLIGGLLAADRAEILPESDQPRKRNRRVLSLPVAGGVLVLEREYKFLDSEIQRARQVLAVCERAAAIGAGTTSR